MIGLFVEVCKMRSLIKDKEYKSKVMVLVGENYYYVKSVYKPGMWLI